MEGSVALFPLTFKCLLDPSSPPSITSHFTESTVFDLTKNDIIPPTSYIKSQKLTKDVMQSMDIACIKDFVLTLSDKNRQLKMFSNNKNVKDLNGLCKALEDRHATLPWG